MNTAEANAYLRSRVLSASPEELRLMLIEGALKFARMGRDGLAKRDYEQSYNGISQCQAILMELLNGLRPEIDFELCSRLSGLYTFMYRRLMDATLEKKPEIVDEVIKLLDYDRETWVMLMKKLEAERPTSKSGSTANHRASVATTSATPSSAGATTATLSVEG